MPTQTDYSRLKRLVDARAAGADVAALVEDQIASELVDFDMLVRDVELRRGAHPDNRALRPFEAAEALSYALDENLSWKRKGKYDPKFASARTVRHLWGLRQAIDSLELPYKPYVAMALQHIGKPNGRSPRLTQLMHRDVSARVAMEWTRRERTMS